MGARFTALAIAISAVFGIAWYAYAPLGNKPSAGHDRSRQKRDDFEPITVIRKPFAVIKDVNFVGGDEASNQVSDATLVLGVELDGTAKAYPIPMLCGPDREIINDRFGDRPIAATW